jgi:SAM-dependent MidA family methyltransferase
MEVALYDPESGYYMGAGNPEGDFRTAADTHPLFAAMLARRLDRAWRELGRPRPFNVLELGSGMGPMADAVFRVARELPWGSGLSWTGVEIGPGRRRAAQIKCSRASFVPDLEQVEPLTCGVIFANEYLDALPFKLARRIKSGWLEKKVGISATDSFVFVEESADPALDSYCSRWGGAIPIGGELEVRSEFDGLFSELATKYQSSTAIFIDYGGSAAQVHSERLGAGTALAYRGMKATDDLLADPGRQDLTAHVNFDAVSESAVRNGFRLRGLTTQAEYLIGLGIGSYLPSLAAGPSPDRMRYEAEREAVSRLLDPRHMGSFRVLELERGLRVANRSG